MQRFDDNKKIRTYKDNEIIKRLFHYMKPVLHIFVIALLLTAVVVAADLVPSFLVGRLVGILSLDVFSTDAEYIQANKGMLDLANNLMSRFTWDEKQFKLYTALICVGLYVIIIIITAVANYNSKLMLQRAGQKIVMNLRRDVFVHIESLSIAQINKTPVGKLVTRVTSDVNMINELFTNVIVNLIRYILTLIFVLVMMILISIKLKSPI